MLLCSPRLSDGTGASANKTLTITVTDPPGNQAPAIQIAALPTGGEAPLKVQFSALIGDPDGDAMSYEWDFADGSAKVAGTASKKTTVKADHTYTSAGEYEATLTVSDGKGGTTTGVARSRLETARRLRRLPATEAALRRGELSQPQAETIADAAAVNPGAEGDLLKAARTRPRVRYHCPAAR